MKQFDNNLLSIATRYLYCRYELSASKTGDEINSIMVLKENTQDHESVVFSIKDIFEIQLENVLSEYPNILGTIENGQFLDVWYCGSEFVCRIGREVTTGPYCENARKETADGLLVKHSSFLMALQELDTMITQTKDYKEKETPSRLSKVIPIFANKPVDNKQ